ncbi:MAG: xylanase [Sphingobacteriales bacterium]|nr:MAG: xylanase [Sphingobacteriales bacterium]
MDTSDGSSDDESEEQTALKFFRNSFLIVFFSSCSIDHGYDNSLPAKFITHVRKNTAPVETIKPVKVKKKKTIYLTFDDGPNKGTKNVLQVINEEQVPVSMFIVGQHVYGSQEQQAIWDSLQKDSLVELCNHSFTHAHNKYNKFYTNDSTVVTDFERCKDSLGLDNNIVRTPGRNIWRTATISSTDIKKSSEAADSLYKDGFTVVGWDVEWRFNDSLKLKQTTDEMINEVDSAFIKNKTKTPEHLVLLAHDQVFADSTDASSLKNFIRLLKLKDEYNIEFVSRYPGLKQQ